VPDSTTAGPVVETLEDAARVPDDDRTDDDTIDDDIMGRELEIVAITPGTSLPEGVKAAEVSTGEPNAPPKLEDESCRCTVISILWKRPKVRTGKTHLPNLLVSII